MIDRAGFSGEPSATAVGIADCMAGRTGSRDAQKKHVIAYTDGSCLKNPDGPGGWGAILVFGAHEKELSGKEASTTNNRMEMTAAIRALECLKEPCRVTLHSDSAYLVNAFRKGWLAGWKRNGWKLAGGGCVKNPDLWSRLDELCCAHEVSFVKVKGHADDELNNRCDAIAQREARQVELHAASSL